MARGWESKSVEDQMDAAESARAAAVKRKLTPEEAERQAARDGLMLSRARTLNALQGASDARYRPPRNHAGPRRRRAEEARRGWRCRCRVLHQDVLTAKNPCE
jgi:hypothetical protein